MVHPPFLLKGKGVKGVLWYIAYKFKTMNESWQGYSGLRNHIFAGDYNTSVYRTLIRGVPIVVLIMENKPDPPLLKTILDTCSKGLPTEIEDQVLEVLYLRRLGTASNVEHHHYPGIKYLLSNTTE